MPPRQLRLNTLRLSALPFFRSLLVVDASSLTIHNALVALGAQARRAPATLPATESLPYPIYHASLQSRRNPYQGKSQGGSDNMVSPFGKLQF